MGMITQENNIKPVALAFKNYDSSVKEKDSCLCLENYYNLTRFNTFKITGQLINQDSIPVDGGVIVAWNETWSHSFHATSRADGRFDLTSSFPFYHWMVSATELSMVRGSINPDSSQTGLDNVPFIDIGQIKLDSLSFLH